MACQRELCVSVVIATRNRPDDLMDCLDSLVRQTVRPLEVIVVDASDEVNTLEAFPSEYPFRLHHLRSLERSAARQRNQGADRAVGLVLLFLDDDVVLQATFVEEILKVLVADDRCRIGAVSGAISNCGYSHPSFKNRLLLLPAIGWIRQSLSGKVIGPAINFMPQEG